MATTKRTWSEQFEKIRETGALSGRPIEVRPGQETLGNAVISAIAGRTRLLAECPTGTGKSVGYLVPAIHDIHAHGDEARCVVSTETTALQDQLVEKDLPFLHSVYGGFSYRALKGRSWYFCLSRANASLRGGDPIVAKIVKTFSASSRAALGDGEKPDVERLVGFEISAETWQLVASDSTWCSDNKCTADKGCYAARARDLALKAQIVVTNHAMLRTDADFRADDGGTPGSSDGLLGPVKTLVVDEAHTLEKVLVDGWSEELRPWDLREKVAKLNTAIGLAASVTDTKKLESVEDEVERLIELLTQSIIKMHVLMAQKRLGPVSLDAWRRETFPLSEIYLSGAQSQEVIAALTEYEVEGPKRAETLAITLDTMRARLHDAASDMVDQKIKGARKVRAGATAARELSHIFELVRQGLTSRDGIVMNYGVPYAIIGDGWQKRATGGKLEFALRIRCVPLDVSERARKTIFDQVKCSVLVSATLRDPATLDFRYASASLGVDDAQVVVVDSPFDYATQQMVYLTPADRPTENVAGARYSFDELVEVIRASNGRTLALFTARGELDDAAAQLRGMRDRGEFDYTILVQEPGTSKQKLADEFVRDNHSVLLATKSFFTGVDFPGETCSTVAICKYPLPQYNALCKAQIAWWRRRGFPKWYEREGLLTFAQAVGRLIRASSDRGVVAILDQRAASRTESVSRSVELGLSTLCAGSYITREVADVEAFLGLQSAETAV